MAQSQVRKNLKANIHNSIVLMLAIINYRPYRCDLLYPHLTILMPQGLCSSCASGHTHYLVRHMYSPYALLPSDTPFLLLIPS